jgi:FKBP-type peptidyl-prolyl cis-trans isomerase
VPSSSHPQTQPAQNRDLKLGAIILIAVIAVVVIAYIITVRRGSSAGPEITTASGLKYVDLKVGDGPSPQAGQTVSVHYVGTLENGEQFDSSRDRGRPADFLIGVGRVIKGWDEGLMTMKVGGRRKLIVPPDLGYGKLGKGPSIPPNSTLVFDVELLGVK